MSSTYKTPINYDPQKYANYQSIKSGTILNIELNHIDTNLLLETHQEVWSPTPFALRIGEFIVSEGCHNKIVIDFASGSGFLSVLAKKSGATKVIATDLNPKAIMMTKHNWALNNLNPDQLYAIESDCFNSIKDHPEFKGQVDMIYSNPPTLPDLEGDIKKLSAAARHGEASRSRVDPH